MSIFDGLAETLGTEPSRLRQALAASAECGKDAWVDAGGIRVAWRSSGLIFERYLAVDGITPAELLSADKEG